MSNIIHAGICDERSLPSVSVVIPCFNSERWLTEAVESVFRQNVCALEVVIVNDGSSDSTQEIAERYGDKVVLINQVNAGVSWARREGVRHATGDYIKFLDSDDILPEGALKDLLEVAIQFPIEAIIGNAVAISSNGNALDESMYTLAYTPSHLELVRKEFLLTQATSSGLWLLPRRLIDHDCFYNREVNFGEEYEFCMQLIKLGISIRYCDRVVYQARVYDAPSRLSRTRDESIHLKQISLIAAAVDFIKNEIKEYSSESLDIISRLCWSRGRDCIRIDCKEAASSYFLLAKNLRPNLRPVGSVTYRMLCRVFGPFAAEAIMQRVKFMLIKWREI